MPDYERMKEQYGSLQSMPDAAVPPVPSAAVPPAPFTAVPPAPSAPRTDTYVPQPAAPVQPSSKPSATPAGETQNVRPETVRQPASTAENSGAAGGEAMDRQELFRQIQMIADRLTSLASSAAASEKEQRISDLERLIKNQQAMINQLCSQITRLEGKVSGLTDSLNTLAENAAKQEKTNIDVLRDSKNFQATTRERMQKELDGYKKTLSATGNAPILTEIANIDISVRKAIDRLGEGKDAKYLKDVVLDSIEELLEDNGVVIHQSAPGTARSVRYCKTMKAVPTGDEALHGAVAKSYGPSFTLENLVMVKEQVDTYQYDPSIAAAQPAEEDENSSVPDDIELDNIVPAESAPAESAPVESVPAESEPADSAPAESEPAESVPAESVPAESESAESEPVDSAENAGVQDGDSEAVLPVGASSGEDAALQEPSSVSDEPYAEQPV